MAALGPPYLPQTAQLGGKPTIGLDVPVSVVLLVLFVVGAATNMTIFQLNQRHGYKFLFSGLLFGFCMARIVALSTRIAWAVHSTNPRIAIASQIFTAAGVLLLFVTNLIFAQRIIRAYHPFFGWSRFVTWLFRALFASVLLVLVMVITVTVQSFFTLDQRTRHIDRTIQLCSAVYLAVYAFLPIPLVVMAALVPRKTRIDKFGEGHFRTKFALLTFTSTLLAAGAIFRAATSFMIRPIADPAWYHSKACYYCFNFVIELLVVYIYALSRFDRRFHIPDGSSAPGHYSMSEPNMAARRPPRSRGSQSSHSSETAYAEMDVQTAYSFSKRNSQCQWSDGEASRSNVGNIGNLGGGVIKRSPKGGRSARSTRSIKSVVAGSPTRGGADAMNAEPGDVLSEQDAEWMAKAMVCGLLFTFYALFSFFLKKNTNLCEPAQRELYRDSEEGTSQSSQTSPTHPHHPPPPPPQL